MVATAVFLFILTAMIAGEEGSKHGQFTVYRVKMAHNHVQGDRLDVCSIIECSIVCKATQGCCGITYIENEQKCCVLNTNSATTFVGNNKATYYIKEEDECMSAPCRNGALCHDLQVGFHCSCVGGFAGRYCQTNLTEELAQQKQESANQIATLTSQVEELHLAIADLTATVKNGTRVAFRGYFSDEDLDAPSIVTYTSSEVNFGNGLNLTTGIFTAPHTGNYWISFWALSRSGNGRMTIVKIRKNTSDNMFGFAGDFGSNLNPGKNRYMVGNAGVFVLNIGDTVDVQVFEGTIRGIDTNSDGDFCVFSGFLL